MAIPVVSGQNNDVQAEVIRLSNEPGNEYLKDLVARNDVNWEAVKLAQESWDYKSQGLTGAGAAIIVIIVTVLTSGAAAGASSAITGITGSGALGAGAGAAVSTIASQASVSLINNGGDIGKTLKDLGSKESVKGLVASVVTAGLLKQVGTTLGLKPNSSVFSERLINNLTNSIGSSLVQTAVSGGNLEDNIKTALLSGLAGALQGELSQNIKDLEDINYLAHKIAHAFAGCAAGAIQGSCEAGALGGAIGEVVASIYDKEPIGANVKELSELNNEILTTSQLISGVVAAYAGLDVNIASNSAVTAIENNSNSEILLEIERQEDFLNGLSPAERSEWETEFKKAGLKLGEFALFVATVLPTGKKQMN